jgi:ribA/ribD-fused uncharacterized protein
MAREPGCIKPDTDTQVFFYEQDFYVLSNFSAFNLRIDGQTFPTSEHAYHWFKFWGNGYGEGWPVALEIAKAPSAHEAFKIAERNKARRDRRLDERTVDVMRRILRAKADQHEYVRRKLLATGDRELIEDSWRDDFWGWGPNRDGQNMLGRLWMEVRAELRGSAITGVMASDEPLRWEFTGIAGLKRFLTQKQYEAQTPGTQEWYRPICPKCGPAGVDSSDGGQKK